MEVSVKREKDDISKSLNIVDCDVNQQVNSTRF